MSPSGLESDTPHMRKRQTAPTTPAPVQPSDLQLVDIPQAAKILSIGRTSIYSLINSGDLKAIKIKSSTRISLAAIQALIQNSQQAS